MKHCLGCMEKIGDDETICPHCGYLQDTPAKELYHLAPGTILHGKYLVGKVIGYGGFGVTYLGWDMALDLKVAIKEYFPSEFATRMPEQQTLSVYTGEAANQFDAGLKSFLEEAQRLAKFENVPGVVKIYDTFMDNKTSYIVMEYLDGETVREHLEREKTFSYDEAERIIREVLYTLESVHPSGIIHRDVSPANIFLTKDGGVKLIDFGAARYASAYHTKSLSVILKPGYAPEEQYRSRGNQGPWTDVYSAAATMYRMLTGKTPQESIERMASDELKEPSKLGVSIDKNKENALMNALNVDASTRTQSAEQFLEELTCEGEVDRKKVIKHKKEDGKWPMALKIALVLIPVIIIGTILILFNSGSTIKNNAFTTVPNIIDVNEDTARKTLTDNDLYMVVAGTMDVDYGDSGLVQDVDPLTGSYIRRYETVSVKLSVNETVFMPEVTLWNVDEAVKRMDDAGLNSKLDYVDSDEYAEDTVISQEFPEGEALPKNKLVTLRVAKGLPETENEMIAVPSVEGETLEKARELLLESQLFIQIVSEDSEGKPYGTILRQDLAGSSAKKNSTICVVVDRGEEVIRMPDLKLKSKEEAEKILGSYGIKIEYRYEETNDYAEDLILGQSIAVGTKLSKGDTLVLTLSKYDYGTVPNTVGLKPEDAKAKIEKAGFQVAFSDEEFFSNDIAKGLVGRQSVVGQYQKGKTVTLILSLGKTTQTANVPDISGLSEAEAQYKLSNAGFSYVKNGEEYSESVPTGNVIRYSPTGNHELGTTIAYVVSKGSEMVAVPNVAGFTEAEAAASINGAGLSYSRGGEVFSDSVPAGWVVFYSPSGNQKLGTVISCKISKGPEKIPVPNVSGMTEVAGQSQLSTSGFTPFHGSDSYSDTVPKGAIISYSPSGDQLPGTTITYVVSKGPENITVPNISGMTEAAGQTQLSANGFIPSHGADSYSETVPKGSIVSYSPSGKQRIGTTVSYSLSRGPEPRAIPNVCGMSISSAQSTLNGIGMNVYVTSGYSDSVPYGTVMSQSVSSGTKVDKGTTITITASCGTSGKYVSESELGAYPSSQYSISPATQYSYQYQKKQYTYSPYSTLSGWNYSNKESYSEKGTTSTKPSSGYVSGNYYVTTSYTGHWTYYVWEWTYHNIGRFDTYDELRSFVSKNYGRSECLDSKYFVKHTVTYDKDYGSRAYGQGELKNINFFFESVSYDVTYTYTTYSYWRWGDWSSWSAWSNSDNAPTGSDYNVSRRTQTVYYVQGIPF